MNTEQHGWIPNREKLAEHFACKTPEQMKWTVEGGLAQCRGCSGCCGTSQIEGNFERTKPEQKQQELILS